jgi:hypothetical protein
MDTRALQLIGHEQLSSVPGTAALVYRKRASVRLRSPLWLSPSPLLGDLNLIGEHG